MLRPWPQQEQLQSVPALMRELISILKSSTDLGRQTEASRGIARGMQRAVLYLAELAPCANKQQAQKWRAQRRRVCKYMTSSTKYMVTTAL